MIFHIESAKIPWWPCIPNLMKCLECACRMQFIEFTPFRCLQFQQMNKLHCNKRWIGEIKKQATFIILVQNSLLAYMYGAWPLNIYCT